MSCTKHAVFFTGSRRRRFVLLLGGGIMLASGFAPGVSAQNMNYPNRSVVAVVPYGPGSANDILVRLLSPELSKRLGTSVVVQNKPGAGGAIGTTDIARATPDGYTIGIGGSATLGVNPNLYKNLSYDVRNDFTPLIRLASTPNVLVVPANSPITSLPVMLSALKTQRLQYNSFGNGTTQHLAGALLVSQANGQADHIPYRSAGEAITAIIGGQVDFGFYALPAVISHIKGGKLRALGVTSEASIPALPDVPPLDSSGFKDFHKTSVWFGLIGPKGISEPIAEKLHAALQETLNDSRITQQLSDAGYVLAGANSRKQFTDFISDQLAFWGDLIRISGARID